VVVPIHAGSKIVGVLEIFSPEPEAFDDWTVLALSHIAQFVGGMAEPVPPPAEETLPPVSSGPEPIVPSDPAGRRLAHGLRQMAARHGRLALLLFAALVTVAAASYRVRDMVRSARAHRRQEVALTAAPSTIPVPTPVPTSSVPADPQIAREDGRVPEATKALSSDHAKKPQDQPPGEPALATTKAASPQPVTVASANAALRAPEVPPSAPNMTVVEPAAERDISIEPLMNAPVASPQLAAAPARPANASIFVLMSRKLRSLVPKKNHEKSEPPASDQAPPAAGP